MRVSLSTAANARSASSVSMSRPRPGKPENARLRARGPGEGLVWREARAVELVGHGVRRRGRDAVRADVLSVGDQGDVPMPVEYGLDLRRGQKGNVAVDDHRAGTPTPHDVVARLGDRSGQAP